MRQANFKGGGGGVHQFESLSDGMFVCACVYRLHGIKIRHNKYWADDVITVLLNILCNKGGKTSLQWKDSKVSFLNRFKFMLLLVCLYLPTDQNASIVILVQVGVNSFSDKSPASGRSSSAALTKLLTK